jgi:hypothetical protein
MTSVSSSVKYHNTIKCTNPNLPDEDGVWLPDVLQSSKFEDYILFPDLAEYMTELGICTDYMGSVLKTNYRVTNEFVENRQPGTPDAPMGIHYARWRKRSKYYKKMNYKKS